MDTVSTILTLVLVANTACGFIVFTRNSKARVNRYFLYFTLSVSLWIISKIAYRELADHDLVVLVCMVLYFAAGFLLLVINYFVRVFLNPEYKFSLWEKILLPLPTVLISFISLYPGLLIRDIEFRPGFETATIYDQNLHLLYGAYIIGYFAMAHIIMLKKYLISSKEKHIGAVIIGIILASIVGVIGNLIMPFIGDFRLNWIGEIGVLGMVIPVAYSLLKHKLFDVRVIIVEILVYILWSILLFRLIISSNATEAILNGLTLLIAIIIGIAVVKNTSGEISTREKAEKLASDLAQANTKLKQLDKLKSELVSLATHHISTPLTAVSGYVSILKEANYGEKSEEEKNVLNTLQRVVGNMVNVVRDFLDVSRIEKGSIQYLLGDTDLALLIDDLVNEYEPKIKSRGLRLDYVPETKVGKIMKLDESKFRHAIANILENSLYFTKSGHIKIECLSDEVGCNILIHDTGTRVLPSMSPELFNLFTSTGDANEASVIGNSLGLYVTKQIIEAHQGRFSVRYDELNKEWVFLVYI